MSMNLGSFVLWNSVLAGTVHMRQCILELGQYRLC